MQLLQSWKESLSIFKPANFKLFLMVTVKCVWETFKIVFGRFWWLIFSLIVGLGLIVKQYIYFAFAWRYQNISLMAVQVQRYFLLFLMFLVVVFYIFIIFLIVRPSVQRKNWNYLRTYIFSWYLFYFELIFILLLNVMLFYYYFLSFTPFTLLGKLFSTSSRRGIVSFANLYPLLYVPLFVFTILFFLDSASANAYTFIKSFLRALKLIIYNFPFCLIAYLIVDIGAFLIASFPLNYFSELSLIPLSFIFYIVPICIFTNFYIKQVHDNFDLYFGKGPSEKEGV